VILIIQTARYLILFVESVVIVVVVAAQTKLLGELVK